jgi:RNA polymerase sigma-70 factor (ECF subfamily)
MDDQKQYFVELIEQNKSIIFKFCYMYSTHKDTPEDLFQEVLINLWKSFPSFRGDSQIQTWIYRISLNTCVTFLRKSGKAVKAVPLTDDMVVFAEESKTHDIKELYTLINKLKAIEKAIILLYLEERSYEEIAQIVGITKSNVGVRIVRIKEKLQQLSSL